jgi:hypothetical protein
VKYISIKNSLKYIKGLIGKKSQRTLKKNIPRFINNSENEKEVLPIE